MLLSISLARSHIHTRNMHRASERDGESRRVCTAPFRVVSLSLSLRRRGCYYCYYVRATRGDGMIAMARTRGPPPPLFFIRGAPARPSLSPPLACVPPLSPFLPCVRAYTSVCELCVYACVCVRERGREKKRIVHLGSRASPPPGRLSLSLSLSLAPLLSHLVLLAVSL